VKEPELKGRFLMPGHHPDPVPLLRGADLFVLPSLSEGLGTSVLDAMALDIPVVASDVGGLTELVGGGAGLLIPPADPRALAEAVTTLLDDPELRKRCIAEGRARVEHYTVRRMAEGMRAVYDSVNATR
jgi:glycosyltransferase involved in cell wall biosynthesis